MNNAGDPRATPIPWRVGEILRPLWTHMRALWPRYTLLPLVPFCLWAAWMASRGMLRWDHVAGVAVVGFTAYCNERTKRFLKATVGLLLIGYIYDASRFVDGARLAPERVLQCNLYELEKSLFGVTASGQRQTLQDYFFANHHPAADYFFAIPYGIFIAVAVGYGIYLFLVDEQACRRYSWMFFALNLAGMITQHLMPAAPPWYLRAYGCHVDPAAPAFEGLALARVDAAVGITYFRSFYGRSSEVFGAIPSLHVAYPLLMLLEGWRRHRPWVLALMLTYFVWMCVAAVYLDHHWVIDVVAGCLYAVLAVWVTARFVARRPIFS